MIVVAPNEKFNIPRSHPSRRESRIGVPQLEFLLGTASALFEPRITRGAPTLAPALPAGQISIPLKTTVVLPMLIQVFQSFPIQSK